MNQSYSTNDKGNTVFRGSGFLGQSFSPITLKKGSFVVTPVPYDSTVEWKTGSREGPRAIIEASNYLELFDPELGLEVNTDNIITLPDMSFSVAGPKTMVTRVYHVGKKLLQHDCFPVMLGGEHSLTSGMVQACKEKYPDLSVLYLDAHADLRQSYMGSKYSHACVMDRLSEICPSVLVGVRSLSRNENELIKRTKLRVFSSPDAGVKLEVDRIVSDLSSHVYVTVDLDVFDPSLMPAVGTPEPGGLYWNQVLELLRSVTANRSVVGFDIMELAPNLGPPACSFTAAKLVFKLIGYIMYSNRR